MRDYDYSHPIKIDESRNSINLGNYKYDCLAVQLNCINKAKISSEFDHLMYLFKYGVPYDKNNAMYKEFVSCHHIYLNSFNYQQDYDYEIRKALDKVD